MSASINMAAQMKDINETGNLMKFVTSISSRHVEHWTVSQFIKHAEAQKPMTVFEYLQDNVLTKPYFDYEKYYDEEPSANEIYSVLSGLKYSIRDCFRGEDDFDETKQVAYAQRHGWVAKPTKEEPNRRQFKASFRAYVLGYAIQYTQMPHFIREHAVGWEFDLSVYKSKEQLYGCLGGCKGRIPGKELDERILVPLTHHNDPSAFLVQALHGREKLLQCTAPELRANKGVSQRPMTSEEIGLKDLDTRIFPAAMSALVSMDPPDACSRFTKASTAPDGSVSLYMRTNGERKCPLGNLHCSNNFYVRATMQGLLWYKCLGSVCIETEQFRIGRWIDPFEHAQDLSMVGVKALDDKEYLKYFNKFFALVKADRPVFMEFHYDERGRVVRFNERTLKATREIVAPCKEAFEAWHLHPEKRQYDEIVYEPNPVKVKPYQLNTYIDIRVEREHDVSALAEADMEIVQPILWHIEHILCRGDAEFYNYLLRWIALPLQQRGERTTTLVCINGDQGTGKGLVFDELIGNGIYGDMAYVQVKNADDLLGKFNNLTARRLLINLDEPRSFGGCFKDNGTLKNIITESRTTLERKGLDSVSISNYASYILTTNSEVPLKIESTDRRYAVIKASGEKCGDLDYFEDFAARCTDPQTALHFYKHLLSIDLTGWNSRKIPMTPEKKDMMTVVIEPEWGFLQAMIEDGHLEQADCRVMPVNILFSRFMAYCTENNTPTVGKTPEGLIKVLKRLLTFESKRVSLQDKQRLRCAFLPDPDHIQRTMIAGKKWVD